MGCMMLASCGDKESSAKNDDPQEVRIVSDKTEEEAHEKWKDNHSLMYTKRALKGFEREIDSCKRGLQRGRMSLDEATQKIAKIEEERMDYVRGNLNQVKGLEEKGSVRKGIAQDILEGVEGANLEKDLKQLSKEAEEKKARLGKNPFLRKS